MALFKWLAETEESCLLALLRDRVVDLGVAVDGSVSNSLQVYAVDSQSGVTSHHERVKLIASWTDRSAGELQIEVMSDEPLLLRGTRCEQMATALQGVFPPK
jgi:hypothetical protein